MYYFYIGGVLLPVAPEKFELKVKNANKTITLINEGEVNILKQPALTDLQFDALLPAVQYPFAQYDGGFKSPSSYLNHFESLKTSKKPFQFIITRQMPNGKMLFNTNMTVSMENYTVEDQAGEGFDLIVSIDLKQYRSYGTKTVTVNQSTSKATVTEQRDDSTSPAPEQDTSYTVESGDCLWNIAKAAYGDGSMWEVIYEANKDTIEADAQAHGRGSSLGGTMIWAGLELTIPNVNDAELTVQKLRNTQPESPDVDIYIPMTELVK